MRKLNGEYWSGKSIRETVLYYSSIDKVSVSKNYSSAENYQEIVKSPDLMITLILIPHAVILNYLWFSWNLIGEFLERLLARLSPAK